MKNYPFEKLYFVWGTPTLRSSGLVMCYQPFIACKKLGVPVEVSSLEGVANNIHQIKNSVLVFIKSSLNQRFIDYLKMNNNKVVIVPGDGHIDNYLMKFSVFKGIDCIVVASESFKGKIDMLNKQIKTKVLTCSYDYFLDSNTFREERDSSFRLFYGGSKDYRGLPLQGNLGIEKNNVVTNYHEGFWRPLKNMCAEVRMTLSENEKYVLENSDNFSCNILKTEVNSSINPSRYSCHYAVRAPWIADYKFYWETKSATKVITAAGSESNIITSLDPAVKVLLNEDYPYAIDTETDHFKINCQEVCNEMIRKAKDTYKSKMWYDGLEIMRAVKEKTTCEKITQSYVDLAIELCE